MKEKDISEALIKIGITPNLKGYHFMSMAIMLLSEDTLKYCDNVSNGIYSDVAKKYKTNIKCVERAIRYAKTKSKPEFGYSKMTSSEALFTLAEMLKQSKV